MYNRYIPNDNGRYRRIPMQEEPGGGPPPPPPPPEQGPPPGGPPPHGGSGPQSSKGEKRGFLSGILRRLRLDGIDTGDLLLLLIL